MIFSARACWGQSISVNIFCGTVGRFFLAWFRFVLLSGSSLMLMHKLNPMRCCQAANAAAAACDSTKSSSPSSLVVIPYHTQACLAVWNHVLKCICRLGRMLLYGLQGQQEGDHGEVRA